MMNTQALTNVCLASTCGAFAWACDGNARSTPTWPDPPPAYTLSGTISAGTPTGQVAVEGARVRVESQETKSDADGYYSVPRVPAGSHRVTTSKSGFETDSRTVTMTADMRLDILVARIPTFTLSGIVSELTATGDVPLRGVEVYWSEYKGTFTDVQGFYRIEGLYSGVQPLWVAKDGYTFATAIPHPLGEPWRDVTIAGDTQFDVQLVRR